MENSNKQISVKTIVGSVLACFMLLGLTVYGVYYNIKAETAERELRYQYDRAFTDMVDYVSASESYILKALAASTPGTVSRMLDETSKYSAQAEARLASLPIDQHTTEKISEYLVQLGDIADSWSHRAINGGALTEEEYETLAELYGYAQDLTGVLSTLRTELTETSYAWNRISQTTLDSISNPFTDYPRLSYDGKYSYQETAAEPKGLSGYERTEEECRNKAIEYFAEICNCAPEEITAESCNQNSQYGIETYCFSLNYGDNVNAHIDITKKGAMLYTMLISRPGESSNLTVEQGIEAGKSFLQSLGMSDMSPTVYSYDDSSVTATYSYVKNDVVFYPDSVKVKIALDNGSPLGFDGHSYWRFHSEDKSRLENVSISMEDARAMLSSHLTVQDSKEVIAEDVNGGEYRAYEFTCSVYGHPVLVYIDAATGIERDVVLLMEYENGLRTV